MCIKIITYGKPTGVWHIQIFTQLNKYNTYETKYKLDQG